VKINKYGLQWTVKIPTDFMNPIVLQQGGGLVFLGRDNIDIFWGPYLEIDSMQDRNGNIYDLPEKQMFFASEIEEICLEYGMHRKAKWYHILQEGFKFPKEAFEQKINGFWCMQLTAALNNKIENDEDTFAIAKLFRSIHFTDYGDYPRKQPLYIKATTNQVFLNVDNDTYNSLPNKWTIWDIYNINASNYDNLKKRYEQLWYNIAEARRNNMPVKISIFVHKSRTPLVYTEQKTKYGIVQPAVLSKNEDMHDGIV